MCKNGYVVFVFSYYGFTENVWSRRDKVVKVALGHDRNRKSFLLFFFLDFEVHLFAFKIYGCL